MTTLVLSSLTPDELRDLVREAVAEALEGTTRSASRLATKADLARELACSVATVDRMTSDGMPFVRVGRTRRFDVEACRAWCGSRSQSRPEPEPTKPAGVRIVSRGAR
jgi:excisionase family DNA binding protein